MDSTDENEALDEQMSIQYMIRKNLLSKNKLAIILNGDDGITQYCCVECPLRYTDKSELELHLCTHIKEFRFLCGICGKGLKRREHLERHTLEHQELRPYVCSECSKAFKRKEHLNIHMAIHTGDKTQECTICGRSFNRKDHLQKHLQTHNKLFLEQNIHPMTDEEMMDIKEEVIDDEVSPIITNVISEMDCSEDYDVSDSNNGSDYKETRFACYMCEKTYKMKEHFKRHIESHFKKEKPHVKEEKEDAPVTGLYIKPYEADDSQWTSFEGQDEEQEILPDDSELLVARSTTNKSDMRPHECTLCQKRFKRRQHLKVHMNVHMKHQPTIWCSLCNEGFFMNEQFENHLCSGKQDGESQEANTRTHDKKENKLPPGGIRIVQDSSEKDEATYMVVHDEQNIPVPQRVYVCKFCSKPFRRKDHYKIHLHIHTGVKSFFCETCGKGFYRKDHLQKHGLVHDKVKPKLKPKKKLPDLYPINTRNATTPRQNHNRYTPQVKPEVKSQIKPEVKSQIKPEITITAPSNAKLRVPLQIKVPYQMVVATESGEQQAVTIDPQSGSNTLVI